MDKQKLFNFFSETMAPNLLGTSALFLAEATNQESLKSQTCVQQQFTNKRPVSKVEKPKYRWEIVWRNVIAFLYLHTFAIYGLYLAFFVCTWKTFVWCEYKQQINPIKHDELSKTSFRNSFRLFISCTLQQTKINCEKNQIPLCTSKIHTCTSHYYVFRLPSLRKCAGKRYFQRGSSTMTIYFVQHR